jgi:hypothetical protein
VASRLGVCSYFGRLISHDVRLFKCFDLFAFFQTGPKIRSWNLLTFLCVRSAAIVNLVNATCRVKTCVQIFVLRTTLISRASDLHPLSAIVNPWLTPPCPSSSKLAKSSFLATKCDGWRAVGGNLHHACHVLHVCKCCQGATQRWVLQKFVAGHRSNVDPLCMWQLRSNLACSVTKASPDD